MYAIIRAGGHQERVEAGDRILIDRVKTEVGETMEFSPLLVSVEGEAVSNRAQLKEKASVVGTVIEHVRGDKIDVFMYRQKTGYRRHIGHRSALTVVEISEIRMGDQKAVGESVKAEKAQAKEAAVAEMNAKREAGRAKRAEAKVAAAKKKAPAKKTAAATVAAVAKKAAPKKTGAKKTAAKKK